MNGPGLHPRFRSGSTHVRFVFHCPPLGLWRHPVTVAITDPVPQLAPVGECVSPFGFRPLSHWRVAAVGREGTVLTVDLR
jgi:hypothetical protein